jgi:hypothetical protein
MNRFADPEPQHGPARDHARVIELSDVAAVALMLLTVALFSVMIWAGNHQH